MLNPKTYQTPNALDPGEAPPSRPSRNVRRTNDDARNVEIPSVEEVRMNAARLLSDEEDPHSTFPYDKDDDDVAVHDQLPSVEEARQYAGRILRAKSGRDLSPDHIERQHLTGIGKSIPLVTPPHQIAARNRLFRRLFYGFVVVMVIVAISAIAVHIQRNHRTVYVEVPLPKDGPTNAPTAEVLGGPPSERLMQTISFLVDNEISTGESLSTTHSPQHEAASWIADRDGLQYDIPTSTGPMAERFIQRYVLAVFYYSLGGPNWGKQYKFLGNENECGWFERDVLKSGEVYAVGISCNNLLEVEDILVPRNRLRGTIPTELSILKALSFLDLNRNSILGGIPDEFVRLETMIFLDLRYNLLTGTIPPWIGSSMSGLEVLALSDNLMVGEIPPSVNNLVSLKTLALDDNDFGGLLDPVNSLSNLEYLYLDNNQFRGVLGDTTFASLQNLKQLDLSGNSLSGDGIPLHFFEHPKLTVMDLHDNDLGGNIPELIPRNSVLKFLALQDNALNGRIPLNINNLVGLTHLDLTGNELTGQIPDVLGDMVSLTYLFLSENDFTQGPIPASLIGLANLRELSLGSTNRQGTIPAWLGVLDNLILVDLSRNSLAGTIPEELWDIRDLSYMLLQRNKLTGDVPTGLTGISSLKMLLLDKNDLRGDMNEECANGLNLQHFVADCAGSSPELACPCCTLCCQDGDTRCNDDILYANVDPKWENNYTRSTYSFSPKVLFDAST